MNASQHPVVSVVTPVYNGDRYLRECIESVLSQTFQNWEYIIVDNVSKDGTRKIAEEYALKDKRIRVYSNDTFLPIIANHNRAFSFISPYSKLCKVVSADDCIFPECLSRLVDLAEANPSVGIMGSYQLSGGEGPWRLRNHGIPYFRSVIPGREIGRAHLLGTLSVLGNPTSNCYRADLVRGNDAFFPNATAEADVSACVKHLQVCDFGFVHQVLSYERVHEVRVTTLSLASNAYVSAAIDDCVAYGMAFLTKDELEARVGQLLREYYRYLAVNALKFRGRSFWDHHENRLREIGYPLDRLRLSKEISMTLFDRLLNPKATAQLVLKRMRMRGLAATKADEQSTLGRRAGVWNS
jgi:glycosyltransferase involved in cell wall biosynthesis